MPCHNFVSSYSANIRNNTLINNWISNIIDCFIVQRSLHFRNRIGEKGMELILAESIRVNTDHDNEDHFDTAFIDSTVQEKNITYPTDAK